MSTIIEYLVFVSCQGASYNLRSLGRVFVEMVLKLKFVSIGSSVAAPVTIIMRRTTRLCMLYSTHMCSRKEVPTKQ